MLTDWSNLIVGVVSLLIFTASEFFLPVAFKDSPLATRQKHFYSILLTVFSLVMTLTLTTSFETQQKIENIEKVFTSVADSPLREDFQNIFTNYYEHFRQPSHSPLLEPWVNRAIESLSKEMQQTSVSVPSKVASAELHFLYKKAEDYIVATHVGPVDRYFDNENYTVANERAADRGIPVVRFYLEDNDVSYLEDYSNKVSKLHKDMNTLMSVVIPKENLDPQPRRDLLVADGSFLAETNFHTGTTRITGDAAELRGALKYLSDLLGITVSEQYVHYLPDEEVRRHFRSYKQVYDARQEGEKLARAIADHLLRE